MVVEGKVEKEENPAKWAAETSWDEDQNEWNLCWVTEDDCEYLGCFTPDQEALAKAVAELLNLPIAEDILDKQEKALLTPEHAIEEAERKSRTQELKIAELEKRIEWLEMEENLRKED